ncbi:hypothetical protein [Faecalibaculum rodentium]|uniref:hypothetical protein n=1 Tax=Faecalibaculum rodentium TaxID=1702221 RepID=UPI00266FD14A|nr:hypothetical protein [Faecalibaculum rodentium]
MKIRTTGYRTYASKFPENFNPFEGMTINELERVQPECSEDVRLLRKAWDAQEVEIPNQYLVFEKVRCCGQIHEMWTGEHTYPDWQIHEVC